jgi:hypothetical protein
MDALHRHAKEPRGPQILPIQRQGGLIGSQGRQVPLVIPRHEGTEQKTTVMGHHNQVAGLRVQGPVDQ